MQTFSDGRTHLSLRQEGAGVARPNKASEGPMSERDDIDHLIRSVTAARNLLRDYIGPGSRSAVDTVDRLDVLDDRDFVGTLDRLNRRKVIRLIE